MEILARELFFHQLADELMRPREGFIAEARLIEDLDLDSFELFRMMVFIEQLTPIELPEDLDLSGKTLDDVHSWYTVEAAGQITQSSLQGVRERANKH